MTDLLNDLLTFLPEDWSLANLINLEPGWEVIIKDDEHVAVGTGDTVEEALESASSKAFNGEFLGRLITAPRYLGDKPSYKSSSNDLLSRIGMKPKPPTFARRV